MPCNRNRFAITLWFIDAEERDRRQALDAIENAQHLSATTSIKHIEENENIEQAPLVEMEKISRSSSNIYRYKVIFQHCIMDASNVLVDIGINTIRISAKDASFSSLDISSEVTINKPKTKAKWNKKSNFLTIDIEE